MPNFEQLVRPFQLPDTAPPKVIPPPPSSQPQRSQVLQYGKTGTGKVYHTSYSADVKLYMTAVQKEVSQNSTGGPTP